MRKAITLARRHGNEAFAIVADNTVPFGKQLDAFKSASGKEHPQFAEIQIWQSDSGMVKRRKFQPPAPPAPEEKAPPEKSKPSKPAKH